MSPILFAAHINDIVRSFSYSKPVLYKADVLKVIFSINLSDINNSCRFIMRDLIKQFIWSQATGLQFNLNRCVALHYGANNPNFVHTACRQISALVLGVTRSTNLYYDEHCSNLIRRANSTSIIILRIYTSASHHISLMSRIFVAHVRPRVCVSSLVPMHLR